MLRTKDLVEILGLRLLDYKEKIIIKIKNSPL